VGSRRRYLRGIHAERCVDNLWVSPIVRPTSLSSPEQPGYARWHMFEEKREAVMAIESAVLPLMPKAKALAA
jgi:hypothetical protein